MTSASKSTYVFGHRHLLGIEGLSAADITGLLDLSEEYVELNRQIDKKRTSLRGRTQVNLFFEASTARNPRSRSRENGSRRRHEHVGELVLDAQGRDVDRHRVTLNAMHPDILVVRHQRLGRGGTPGAQGRRFRDQRGRRFPRASHAGALGRS